MAKSKVTAAEAIEQNGQEYIEVFGARNRGSINYAAALLHMR